ncbi:thioredoxin family protein [Patescibacteria group bacterium]
MKVVKIGAAWCSGCIVMGPRWKNVEEEHPWLISEYFDYDNSPEAVEKYGLEQGKLPTFIFLDKEDNELERTSGEISEKKIVELITKYKDN